MLRGGALSVPQTTALRVEWVVLALRMTVRGAACGPWALPSTAGARG
jgi:hypothetical protein